MGFNDLRLEYALDGSSNYIAWKDRMEVVLEDNGLKDFIDQGIQKPEEANAQELAEWKKCVAKERRILLEGVRDHIVSSLHGKENLFSMWKTLKDLYQNSSDQRKLALKDKLQKIKCEKGDTISTYMNKLTTYRDELGSVGIMTTDDDMEEIRRSTRDGSSSKNDDEENIALVSKVRKGKGKASHSKSSSSHCGKKIDKSKVRCFNCHEVGYGASFHMTDDKNLFSTLEEKDLKMHIEMGDDGKYHVLGEGIVVFYREHGSPLTLIDAKYVPGVKKNLLSVMMLEDNGYDVVFSKGKAFLRHIATGQTKRIWIRVNNLYKMEVDDCAALSSKVESVQSQDIGELWHRRLGHLHHGALMIMQ
eukprot:PITA_36303